MMKRALLPLVIATVLSCSQKQDTASQETLVLAVKNFNEAFERGDVERLDQLITENYVHTNGSWKAFGKNEWLEYMRKRRARIDSGELQLSTYRMDDLNIEMHKTSAFVTGKIVMEGTENGESFKKEIRVSNFWVNKDGQWKRAGFHDTRIENPAP